MVVGRGLVVEERIRLRGRRRWIGRMLRVSLEWMLGRIRVLEPVGRAVLVSSGFLFGKRVLVPRSAYSISFSKVMLMKEPVALCVGLLGGGGRS